MFANVTALQMDVHIYLWMRATFYWNNISCSYESQIFFHAKKGEAPIYNLHGCSPTNLGLTQTDGNGERDAVVVEASTAIDYIMRERHYKNNFLELLGAQVCVDLCFRMWPFYGCGTFVFFTIYFFFFFFLPFNGMSPTRCLEVGRAGQKPHILY